MISVRELHKTFAVDRGVFAAVRDVNFEVPRGEIFTLLGPSGCGKTTILRCIAGLESPDSGEIAIDGTTVFSSTRRTVVGPHRRGVGMVFQSYAIWPHLTVSENVALPLKRGTYRVPKGEIAARVGEALRLVQLEALAERPAPLLSGGQQQRIALARALAYAPRVLLLDEPLSNLDAKLRTDMRLEIHQLVKRLKLTAIYVTHDQEEALVLSDRIAVVRDGKIEQIGTPRDVYLAPRSEFVARFMGAANLLEGRRQRDGFVSTAAGTLRCQSPEGIGKHEEVILMFRPDAVVVHGGACDQRANCLRGKIERTSFMGSRLRCEIRVGASLLFGEFPASFEKRDGEEVTLEIPPGQIRMFAR
jgi:iron(III) transport system ATP-binding protein